MGDRSAENKSQKRILLEQETQHYALRLEVSADEMECRATLKPLQGSACLPPDEFLRLLKKAGVVCGVNGEAVATLCRLANEGKPQESVPVAAGIPSEPGADGWIEFFVRTSSKEIRLQENEEGHVDLRNLNFFTNVVPGDRIALLHPPENGPAGSTVTGLPVPPVAGKAENVRCGVGVRMEEGRLFFAEEAGRVLYEGDTVSVTEEYSVGGDVDFSVGSIDFRGFVDIRGDVLDEFDVRGEKGISIGGSIGACRIESDGNIELGSMAGKGKGVVRCGGNLVARYLNDVHVECAGNVVVANEIRNSTVKAVGSIRVENGVISGGECVAMAGIEAKDIGSYLGVRTRLTSGVYYPEVDRMNHLNARLRSLNEQIHRIQDALGPLNSRKSAGHVLGDAVRKRMAILTVRLEELTEEKDEICRELASFRHQDHPTANAKINVRNWLGEGVGIALGQAVEEIRLEMSGPLSIIENTREGGLRYLTLSPLTLRAVHMEEEALGAEAIPDESGEDEE